MTKEEDFFKENFPEYVTEKGEFLTPYWDLFNAGVICATFELNNEIAELKELLKEAIQLLKNSDELYSYQIRDFQLKCDPFIKGE